MNELNDRTQLRDLNAKMARVEELVAELESCPDTGVRDQVRELVGALMDFHGEGLARIMDLASEARETIGADAVAGSLLLLYGLHPSDLSARLNDALEQVRPSLHAHKGDVEILEVGKDSVRLKLVGTCNGCPSSSTTFKNLIEQAISERAPEIDSIHVEGMEAR